MGENESKNSGADNELYRLYVTEGRSTREIAALEDCAETTIRNRLKRAGIPTRSLSQARLLALKRGKLPRFSVYDYDTHFFHEWSEAMAWVLGLLFTDGVFYDNPGRRQIRLALNDRTTLEKVRTALQYTGSIKERPQSYDKSNIIFLLEFGREEIFEDLRRLGLKPRKSLDMQFPDVPAPHVRHFIRGCWDGDGGFTLNEKTRIGGAHYTSGALAFITRIAEELGDVGIKSIRTGDLITIYKRRNAKAYDLRISTMDNLRRLFDYLYAGVSDTLYMTSKHDKLSALLRMKR